MDLKIEPNSEEPLYKQLQRQIQSKIIRLELKKGSLMPSIRVLAARYKVSVVTVQKAYKELLDEGLIEVIKKKGFFVSTHDNFEKRLEQSQHGLYQALDSARDLGLNRTKIEQIINDYWSTES